jgi:quercetin dioxygenase-like cupin family protein
MKKAVITKRGKVKPFTPDFHQETKVWELINPKLGSKYLQFRISKMSPGGTDDYHSHPDSEQIIYVLKGKGKLGVGKKTYSLSKDVFAFIPPGVRHHVRNDGNAPFQFVCLWAPPPKPKDWVPPKK